MVGAAFVSGLGGVVGARRGWHASSAATSLRNQNFVGCARTRRSVLRMEVGEAEKLGTRTKEVFMPALSSTMTDGRIVQWIKTEGEYVEAGEIVMVVESDKADMDCESFESGYIASILVQEGESCGVGTTVALLAETKEDIQGVQDCGVECIVSGSGSRHDGTTAVVEPEIIPTTPATALPDKPRFSEITMPALSSTMEEGKVVDWLVSEGDQISQGDMILTVESDKADMDFESFDDGYLAYISTESGDSVKVGEAVGYLALSKEDIPIVRAYAEALHSPSSSAPPTQSAPVPTPQSAPPSPAPVASAAPEVIVNEGRIIASPYAKAVAAELGVNLRTVVGTSEGGAIQEIDVREAFARGGTAAPAPSAVPVAPRGPGRIVATPEAKKLAKTEKIALEAITGTGNFGRITAEDVLRAAGKSPVPAKSATSTSVAAIEKPLATREPRAAAPTAGSAAMSAMQKAVVKNMNATVSVPVFRASYSIKTTALDELYAKLKPKGVTVSALLAKAVAIVLEKHPIINARYDQDSIAYNDNINIAMAVALPDGGLITPVLQKANEIDIHSLSRNWKDLIKRAVAKNLTAEEYSSGTFVISNLGMFGVTSFDAILPGGVGSILAVAASKPVVGVGSNGLVKVEKEMIVNITCDHRHIYGAQGAEFLRDLADLLENNIQELLM